MCKKPDGWTDGSAIALGRSHSTLRIRNVLDHVRSASLTFEPLLHCAVVICKAMLHS